MSKRSRRNSHCNSRKNNSNYELLESKRMLASVGWDGAGQGTAELTYFIGEAPTEVGQETFENVIEQALDAWSDVVDVTFTQTDFANQRDSLDITFRRLDGEGGTLAQAYLPDDVNRARIAGDIQFDSSENWEVGNGQGSRATDLLYVAVHEIGHALGLEHSDVNGSVLEATVSPNQFFTSLDDDDRDAALALYAPAVVTIDPTIPTDTETTTDDPVTPVDETDTTETETETPVDSDTTDQETGEEETTDTGEETDDDDSDDEQTDREERRRRFWNRINRFFNRFNRRFNFFSSGFFRFR